MSDTIDIGMGELSVAKTPSSMITSGVGSCVVICLFSTSQKAGAMAHIMLPKRTITSIPIDESQYKYADVAIPVMLESLEKEGIRKTSLVAKIAGGANMFTRCARKIPKGRRKKYRSSEKYFERK